MTVEEIIEMCNIEIYIHGTEAIFLAKMPGRTKRGTCRKELCSIKGSPFGEIIRVDDKGMLVVAFNAIDTKNFICKLLAGENGDER